MSNNKKIIRERFRAAVFFRDKNKCKTCGAKKVKLDAHHITDRNEMPNGGYVKENGISLCENCHVIAEIYHNTGEAAPDFSPEDLYNLIGSSHDIATRKSEAL